MHHADARLKLIVLLAFLISLSLLKNATLPQLALCACYLLLVMRIANLPTLYVLRNSLLIFPFVGFFSLIIWLGGDPIRALVIVCKSYLSALAVMICIASTPLPELVQAARTLRAPAFLVDLTQLVYRYLFVLGGEIRTMRTAFLSRGGRPGNLGLQSATGMVAVLFGRAYESAAAVNNAMLSRGFSGTFPAPARPSMHARDLLAGIVALVLLLSVRLV